MKVMIQNQHGAGKIAKKWDKTGLVLENLGYNKYRIKVDGSGRVTDRNRQYLRKFTPVTSSLPGPSPERHDIPEPVAEPAYQPVTIPEPVVQPQQPVVPDIPVEPAAPTTPRSGQPPQLNQIHHHPQNHHHLSLHQQLQLQQDLLEGLHVLANHQKGGVMKSFEPPSIFQ